MYCKLCNQNIGKSGFGLHLKSKHNMSSQEYYDKYLKKEGEGICLTCGKPTSFRGIIIGYSKFCSAKCASNDPIVKARKLEAHKSKSPEEKQKIIDKRKKTKKEKYGDENYNNSKQAQNTCLERYGSNSYLNSKEWLDNKTEVFLDKFGTLCPANVNNQEKAKQTKLERYGDENYNNREKTKITCLKKYGVTSPAKSEEIKNKIKQTCLDKEGVEWTSQLQSAKEKVSNTKKKNSKQFEKDNNCTQIASLIKQYGQGWYKSHIIPQDNIIKDSNGFGYIKNSDIEKIIEYASINHHVFFISNLEKEVVEFIKSIYSGIVIENTKRIIKPNELDIYIPDKNLAIEVNGMYWHSIIYKSKNYHKDKTEKCEQLGIRLIHIFEHDWLFKPEICKSIIASALGIYERRIYARNCEIKEVESKLAKEFLNINHIQGAVNSSYRLGLFYHDELVQLITIGKSRFKSGEYELLRMCTKLNTQIVGGFSKLLKHQPYDEFISYVDRSLFTGASYYKNKFTLVDITSPGFFYWREDTGKLNRIQCQKHRLKELLGDEFDSNLTATENMINAGFFKIYDVGNLKLKFNKGLL